MGSSSAVGDGVAPAFRRRTGREPLEQLLLRASGEPARLQERDQEAQWHQDPGGDDHPLQLQRHLGIDVQDPGGEAVGEIGGQEQQRRDGDGQQRAPLRSRRGQHPPGVDHDHAGHDDQRDVDLELARHLHQLRRGRDLERVGRAVRRAAGQRPAAGDDRREERPGHEEGEDAGHDRVHQPARRRRFQPPHRERQEQVDREDEERPFGEHAEAEEQRRVRGLPGREPGEHAEEHQQRPEPARRPPVPPVEPDGHRRGGQIAPVQRRRDRSLQVLAAAPQPQRHGDHRHDGDAHDHQRAHGRARDGGGGGAQPAELERHGARLPCHRARPSSRFRCQPADSWW